MYDPARDIYTASDGPAALEECKVREAQGQEHPVDTGATIGPGTGQGTSCGALGQGGSDNSSASTDQDKQQTPAEPTSLRRDDAPGATTVGQTTSSTNNHPEQTFRDQPSTSKSDVRAPTSKPQRPPGKSERPLTGRASQKSVSDSAEDRTTRLGLQANNNAGYKEQEHRQTSSKSTHTVSPDRRRRESMDGNTPQHAQNGKTEVHVALRTDSSSPKETKKPSEDGASTEKPVPDQELPRFKRKRQAEHQQKSKRQAKATPSAYSRRDASPTLPQDETRQSNAHERQSPGIKRRDSISKRSRSPSPIRRSPSPDSAAAPAPQRKRPGGGARVSSTNVEALRRRREEREQQQQEEARKVLFDRGVHEVVTQHYNAVPQRGREWRKTDSKIKGLRSFNNWVKSTLIQRFSPDEDFLAQKSDSWASHGAPSADEEEKKLLVLDVGCGKGGDLGKWQQAPQPIDLYVGLDPADVSIDQARDRYAGMRNPRNRGPRNRGKSLFHAEFFLKDCFGEWIGDIPIIQRVGIDPNVGPEESLMASRWGGGGFDVVVCMFTMHYAFESEEKTRQMLRNVAGSLKKGGRFIGVGPNSDVISAKVAEFHEKKKEQEAAANEDQREREDGEVDDISTAPEWGNNIYRVRFPGNTPEDGIFRPPFGWKYFYFMEEAVEEIPEYVVPWEAFRALTEDYNLELQYRKPFVDIWHEEKDDPELGALSERMGVRSKTDGSMLVSDEEFEAASFYHAFCFYKV